MKQRTTESRNRFAVEKGYGQDTPKKAAGMKNMLRKLKSNVDLPMNVLANVTQIQVQGNTYAEVERCKGILEYDENTIKLQVVGMNVRFTGVNLTAQCMNNENAIITGDIFGISFEFDGE